MRHLDERPFSRLAFYLRGIYRDALPFSAMRQRVERRLQGFRLDDLSPELRARLDFYHQINAPYTLADATPIGQEPRRKSIYYIDYMEFARSYGPDARVTYIPGDVTHIPDTPSIVKSRPIAGDNRNSIILKMEKFRHFNFLNDKVPFREKRSSAVWRGRLHTDARRSLIRRYNDHAQIDVGHIDKEFEGFGPKPFLSQAEQLRCRYILSLEGIDVATNLKWIMSSNSLALSPPLEFETWYLESWLKPGVHFVELAPDCSDLEDKMAYYDDHPDEAEEIIRNAHLWIDQFRDRATEDLLCTLVMQKYLELAGELPNADLPERYFT